MRQNLKLISLGVFLGAMAMVFSCKKATNDAPATNNNGNTNNPQAPKLTIVYPAADTTIGDNPIPVLTIRLRATSTDTTKIDSVVVTNNFGYKNMFVAKGILAGGRSRTSDTTFYNYYTAPASSIGSTVKLTYIIYNSQGKSNTSIRNVKVTSIPVFYLTTLTLSDQSQNGNNAFLNTGNNPGYKIYSTGEVTAIVDTPLRRLVDMCVAHTKGETDMLYSPGYVNSSINPTFADSDIFAVNSTWLLSQRQTTLFTLIAPKYVCNSKTYPDYAHVKSAYTSSTEIKEPRVQSILSPNDNYAFLTSDGRYGAFTVLQIAGGVKMTMAIESR